MISLKGFLGKEVKPALGCTEPGAVALAVARACRELSDRDEVARVLVTVSGSIYKNGMAVGIPGTRGARGNAIAAAMGALCGDSDLGLEVLRNSTADDVATAERWVREGRASICCDPCRSGVYVLASVFTPSHKAVCLIEGSHTNIAHVAVDGTVVEEHSHAVQSGTPTGFDDDGFPNEFKDAVKLADEMDEDDVKFLLSGAEMNLEVAECAFGCSCHDAPDTAADIVRQIRDICAAAAYARMSGILMPVMSSAGSGNHGITAILPVAIAARCLGRGERETAHAIAVSHIGTSFVKRRLGRVSPVCGCSIAAGAGAAAGLACLMGGTAAQMSAAMELLLVNLAGMLCDGAKESCALKVSCAATEAWFAACWALENTRPEMPQGVLGASLEETADNVAHVTRDGMKTVDSAIIEILDRRHNPHTEIL